MKSPVGRKVSALAVLLSCEAPLLVRNPYLQDIESLPGVVELEGRGGFLEKLSWKLDLRVLLFGAKRRVELEKSGFSLSPMQEEIGRQPHSLKSCGKELEQPSALRGIGERGRVWGGPLLILACDLTGPGS